MNSNFAPSSAEKTFAVTASVAMPWCLVFRRNGICGAISEGLMPFVLRLKREGIHELIWNFYVHGVADVFKGSESQVSLTVEGKPLLRHLALADTLTSAACLKSHLLLSRYCEFFTRFTGYV